MFPFSFFHSSIPAVNLIWSMTIYFNMCSWTIGIVEWIFKNLKLDGLQLKMHMSPKKTNEIKSLFLTVPMLFLVSSIQSSRVYNLESIIADIFNILCPWKCPRFFATRVSQWIGLDFIFQFSTSTTQSLLPIILLVSVKRVNTVLCSIQTEQNSMDTRDWNQVRNISRKNNLRINVIILSAFIYLLELVSFSKNAISQLIGSNCELQPLATIWGCVFQFYIKSHSSF